MELSDGLVCTLDCSLSGCGSSDSFVCTLDYKSVFGLSDSHVNRLHSSVYGSSDSSTFALLIALHRFIYSSALFG